MTTPSVLDETPLTASTDRATKLISLETAKQLANEHRQAGRTVVFTNGCFDLPHVGHMTMLEESARMGDALFVMVDLMVVFCDFGS